MQLFIYYIFYCYHTQRVKNGVHEYIYKGIIIIYGNNIKKNINTVKIQLDNNSIVNDIGCVECLVCPMLYPFCAPSSGP